MLVIFVPLGGETGCVGQNTLSPSVHASLVWKLVEKSGGALVVTTCSRKLSLVVLSKAGGDQVVVGPAEGTAAHVVARRSGVSWGAKVVVPKWLEEVGGFPMVVITGGAVWKN